MSAGRTRGGQAVRWGTYVKCAWRSSWAAARVGCKSKDLTGRSLNQCSPRLLMTTAGAKGEGGGRGRGRGRRDRYPVLLGDGEEARAS